jgi:Ca2+-binding RTX toxin-like protein
MDLTAISAVGGAPTSTAWPKLTTDWTIATPLLGSFGTLDTDSAAPKVVVNVTRSGYINAYATDAQACAPSSSPRFHHDNANSGDYRRDAVLPGKPADAAINGSTLGFTAPGDDLLCGTAAAYEVVTSASPITPANFAQARTVGDPPKPSAAGGHDELTLPATDRYVAVRAVDEQGNVGRPAVVDRGPQGSGPCANTLNGTAAKDKLTGSAGGDRIRGHGGADRINAGAGDDCASGQGGADRIKGGDGADVLKGGRGRDRIKGGKGADVIRVRRGGRDRVNCGPGKDTVYLNKRFDRAHNCEKVHR